MMKKLHILISLVFFLFPFHSTLAAIKPAPETSLFNLIEFPDEFEKSCKVVRIDKGEQGNITQQKIIYEVNSGGCPSDGQVIAILRRENYPGLPSINDAAKTFLNDLLKDGKILIEERYSINWIGQAIQTLYNAAIAFAVVFCVVILMWAGILWISAAGNQSVISKAKGYISNALIGLILLLGSYLILYTINPQTTTLKGIQLVTIRKIFFEYTPLLRPETVAADFDTDDATANAIIQTTEQRRSEGYGQWCSSDGDCQGGGFASGLACRSSANKAAFCCKPTGWSWGSDQCIQLLPLYSPCEETYMCAGAPLNASGTPNDRKTCCAPTSQTRNGKQVHRCVPAKFTDGKWLAVNDTFIDSDGKAYPVNQTCSTRFTN